MSEAARNGANFAGFVDASGADGESPSAPSVFGMADVVKVRCKVSHARARYSLAAHRAGEPLRLYIIICGLRFQLRPEFSRKRYA